MHVRHIHRETGAHRPSSFNLFLVLLFLLHLNHNTCNNPKIYWTSESTVSRLGPILYSVYQLQRRLKHSLRPLPDVSHHSLNIILFRCRWPPDLTSITIKILLQHHHLTHQPRTNCETSSSCNHIKLFPLLPFRIKQLLIYRHPPNSIDVSAPFPG